jgi:uncharacterized membrane protein required for colicin V production
MGPIEFIFLSIGVIITLVGLARGYVRELGSTLIILVAIFILTFFETQITSLVGIVATRLGSADTQTSEFLLSVMLTLAFGAIVFMSYSGHTLAFTGTPAPPPQGTLISLAIGLFNGYLISGMLWYYQHRYNYPIIQLAPEFNTQLTERAQTLIEYLPPNLFENPVYWIVPVAVLLIIRVRG